MRKLYFNKLFQMNRFEDPSKLSQAEFKITIFTVRLAVKFPCKMSLQNAGKSLTAQVTPENNVFTFNQDLLVKVEPQMDLQVSAYLTTEKGGSILAGVITSPTSNLASKEGERFSLSLQKCIDPSAVVDLRVNNVWMQQIEKTPNMARSSAGGFYLRNNQSPQARNKPAKNQMDNFETRSQYQGNLVRRNASHAGGLNLKQKAFQFDQPKRFERQREFMGASRLGGAKNNMGAHFENDMHETRTIGGGTINRGRRSSKQKQRQNAKKIAQQTENNLKLDVLKYKMKSEELEKNVADKTKTIKDLKDQILEFQRKNIEKAYMQQELSSKENSVRVLEDRLSNMNSENMTLRETIADQIKTIGELKQNIRFDILKNKEDFQKKQQAIKQELNMQRARSNQLQMELSNKVSSLNKAKKYIEDLESAAEQKIFQHDRIIQDLKKEQGRVLKDLNKKVTDYEGKIQELMKEISLKTSHIGKLSDTILKMEQVQRNNQEKLQTLEMDKNELLIFKNDYNALVKKYSKLEENLRDQERSFKKNLQGKSKEIQQNQDSSTKNVKTLQSKLSSSYEKNKQLKAKIQQLQNHILMAKNDDERHKKQIEKNEKTISELTVKINNLDKDNKAQQTKISALEKEVQNKSANTSHMESLYKIQIEHSKQNISSLTKQLQQTIHKYSTTKDTLESVKNEKTKLQNKIQLQEQTITRNSEYMREKKQQFQAKQNDYKNTIKNLNENVKKYEQSEKKKQKQINGWQIKQLNLKNKIDKLQKTIQDLTGKYEKMEKVTLAKLQEDKDKLHKELESTKSKLHDAIEENKFICNERKKLQSETNKNNKINDVLNEEKLSALNEINKLKNALSRQEKQNDGLVNELKIANDEIKKLNIRLENAEKQNSKNKQMLNETASTVVSLKRTANSNLKDSIVISGRKKQSLIGGLSMSRANLHSSTPLDIRKISEIIETTSKEQQATITSLQESLYHHRQNIDKLEKQLATVVFAAKSTEQKLQENIDELNHELDEAHSKMLQITNNYEDRISKFETEVSKKDKDHKLQKQTINSLRYQLETLKKKMEIYMQQAEIRQSRSAQKADQLAGEVQYHEMTIKTLQNQIKGLQKDVYELEEELAAEKEEGVKKDRYISQLNDKYAVVFAENQDNSKHRKELLEQTLAMKEQIAALKEDSDKTKEMLKQEEKNNKKLQDFSNQLIKQKENIVKVELQSSSKSIELEANLLQMTNKVQNLEEQLHQKDQQIAQLKATIKALQVDIKNLQAQIKENQAKISQINNKNVEKDKKISEKQAQLKDLNENFTENNKKSREQIRKLKEQIQELQKQSQMSGEQKDLKILQMDKQIGSLKIKIQNLNSQVLQKEQLLFFEKQRASLSQSSVNDMKKQNSEVHLIISKYQKEIKELSEELGYKEQALYEYSGKLYQLEQQIEAKQVQGNIRVDKMDNDWQCRHDQICEQYEQRIEYLQKDKKYMKDKYDLLEQEKNRLMEEKEQLMDQLEKDVGNTKNRSKEIEQQKMQQVNLKNKEIEKLRGENTMLNNQLKTSNLEMKKKDDQIKNKQAAIRKLEVKIVENDKAVAALNKKFQTEINQLKKNQIVFKNYKEQIKNSQWVVERQVKKITQVFIQKVINCCPDAKEKLVEPIRALETSMGSAINFKV